MFPNWLDPFQKYLHAPEDIEYRYCTVTSTSLKFDTINFNDVELISEYTNKHNIHIYIYNSEISE